MAVRQDSGLGPTENRKYTTPPGNREPTIPGHDFVPKDDMPPWAQKQFRQQRKAAMEKRAEAERAKGDQDMGTHYQDNEFNVGPTDAPFSGKDGSGRAKPVPAPTSPDWENNGGRPETVAATMPANPLNGQPVQAADAAFPVSFAAGDIEMFRKTGNVRDEVKRAAVQAHVPTAVALAVAHHMSGLNQSKVTTSGRVGVMGVRPQDVAYGLDPYHWKDNIATGVSRLAELYAEHKNWAKAVAAYGAPSARVQKLAHQIAKGMELPKGYTGNVRVAQPLPGNPDIGGGYGMRGVDEGREFHPGVDIIANNGTPVSAMVGGEVVAAGDSNAAVGSHVVIKDVQGRKWGYFHLEPGPTAKVGDKVKAGARIGAIGETGQTTGNRLYVQLQIGKKWVNPTSVIQRAFGVGEGTITISDSDFWNGADGSGLPATPVRPGTNPTPDGGVVPEGVQAMPVPAAGAPEPGADHVGDAVQQQMAGLANLGPTSPELQNLQKRQQIMRSAL